MITHYYAARKVPNEIIGWSKAKNHDVTFVFLGWSKAKNYDVTFVFSALRWRSEGLYEYNGICYYIHNIAIEDYDLLDAFGVHSQIGFGDKAVRITK